MFKKLLFFLVTLLIALPVDAQSLQNSYKAEYFLPSPELSTQADVRYTIQLANPTGKESSEQFLISLPSGFRATDIEGTVNDHSITAQTAIEQNQLNIVVPLITSEDLKDRLHISLNFKQENVLTKQGKVFELLIPTLLPSSTSESSVIVHLPTELQNVVLMSKPMFSSRTRDTLTWNQVNGKTIQVFFGANQEFDIVLKYQLENNSPIPVDKTVTFPPDTVNQQVVFGSISEQPKSVTIDLDGNILGRYILNPSAKKEITYRAKVLIGGVPKEDVLTYQRNNFKFQKGYLLSPFLKNMKHPPQFSSIRSVYSYVLATLSYDYSQLSNESPRYMHKSFPEIVRSPSNSVCLDYSSLFVSLARQNALYAREIIGYGFSPNEQIRPQSGDLLHSWAEYYNTNSERWIAVDPTWEDTSKIDYFSTFDLNHVALAIRGESSLEPYPAGFYRFGSSPESKLVSASYSKESTTIKKTLLVKQTSSKSSVVAGNASAFTFSVTNTGNVVQYQVPVSATGDGLELKSSLNSIDAISPMQTVEIKVVIKAARFPKKTDSQVTFRAGDVSVENYIKILPTGYNIAFILSFAMLSVLIVLVFIVNKIKNA